MNWRTLLLYTRHFCDGLPEPTHDEGAGQGPHQDPEDDDAKVVCALRGIGTIQLCAEAAEVF